MKKQKPSQKKTAQMHDVQNMSDSRNIDIDKVGIRNISYPIAVKDKAHTLQHTVASVTMMVDLPQEFKGTHMSRFIEVFNLYNREIDIRKLDEILVYMKEKLHSSSAHLELSFPYFIEKSAPVSGATALMNYDCVVSASIDEQNALDVVLTVQVPVQSLCPCSKEISDRGAHNQRSIITVSVRMNTFLWIEDVVAAVEACGSAQVYALLKREDEKYITEHAFDNPMFVEDMVRAVTERLMANEHIDWFSVSAENMESIHNHNACAFIERDKRK